MVQPTALTGQPNTMLAGSHEHETVRCWIYLQSSTATWLLLSLASSMQQRAMSLAVRRCPPAVSCSVSRSCSGRPRGPP